MPEPFFYTAPRLIHELSRDSEDAFNHLYHRYSPSIYASILRYVKEEMQADDLLQNVFIKLWEKRKDLNEVKNLEAYLFVLARNMVFNYLKKSALDKALFSQIALQQPVGSFSTQERLDEKEYARIIAEAVANLPAQQKQVYQLAEEEGMSYQQIAEAMSLSKLTVKKHLELARKSVRGYLNQRFYPYVMLPILFFHDFF